MDADLHIHTHFSDSTLSPAEVISYAKETGLRIIAICDHDVVDGVKEITKYNDKIIDIDIIPGVELSSIKGKYEIHILGYFINPDDICFNIKLEKFRERRRIRIHEIVDRLALLGVKIDIEDVFKIAGKGSVGRLHIAIVLHKNNIVNSLQEAFNLYLGYDKPAYVHKIRLSPQEAIQMIKDAGGVPVLAHPGLSGCDEIIPELIRLGIKGIEAHHPMHPLPLREYYERLAKKYGLIVTGGSDCHGRARGPVLIGTIRVTSNVVEELRMYSNTRS